MICAACPVTEELLGFLDDRLAPSRFADLATHVDACSACQTALDELTRGQAYGLSVLSRDFLVESSGPSGDEPRASSGDIESTDLTSDRQAATVAQGPGPDATTDFELGA